MTGALAHATGRDLGDVLTGGVEVVAMATEVLLLHTSAGGFWTSCYLVCVLLSCFCVAVWTAETTVMAVWDLLPQTPRFRQLLRKPALAAVFGLPWLGYSIGYCNKNGWTTVTRAGQAVFGNFTMILICILECAAIAAVFGARRFQTCWSAMQGRFCGCPYPLLFWGIITPIGLTVLLILSLASVHPIMNLLGLTSFVLSLLLVVISALVLLFTRPGPMRQKWRIMTTPWDLAPHQMQPTYGRYETFTMAGVAH
ncbi:sodium-dependent dopamine transporter-like [Amphibalanus amphitrite]|uniref:sodium-dependent dopamine transporter-like n=1 Tax=Amphibalanus amphitrite TaxID=1232801 RepID=UPI001C908702|nr:sodium-dependent dopamine transporter-like [Amphibalanus amphitrite]